jgi:putative addiction module component (TIGR02574 family)
MTKLDLQRRALELPIEDQLDLAQAIWDQAAPPDSFSSSRELLDALEARLLRARESPEAARPWEEVRARLLGAR